MVNSRKSERAKLYGIKEAAWWKEVMPEKSLEHMLSVAWKKGFEAGDRWRNELRRKADELEGKCAAPSAAGK